jgi:Ca2+-binding RTX toxin-like protein
MVAYIRSDLDFILAQIKIAEAHAAFERGVSTGDPSNPARPLYGPNGSVPAYNVAWGLRTVDGTYNHLLPGQIEWGASDNEFPEHLGTDFKTIMVPAGPGGQLVPVSYTPGADNDGPGPAGPSDVFDPTVRTISNLLVDQTLGNPSAILTGLQRAGIVPPDQQMAVTAQISTAYQPLKPLFNAVGTAEREYAAASAAASASPNNVALQEQAAAKLEALESAKTALEAADDALMTLLQASGIELDGANVKITNAAPDEGLSAPFNSWFTLFGQFFDHGLDLVAKGGNGTVFIPLMPDDPLYVEGSSTNFMVLTRATLAGPGQDGIMGTADDTNRPVNTTTAYVDQNQTYSSHPSHQVFLRQYEMNANGDPVSTGKLLVGSAGGMATWADLKAQAADLLGIQLLDSNVGNIPLLATDPYGEFIRGPNGYPQMVTTNGLVEGDPNANGGLGVLVPANAILTGHAFLADIAHNAVPAGLADGDIEIGLENPGNEPGVYDNELLDAHFVAGDGRANENIGLTAVHHVFHSEHNRLVEHTKAVVLADAQEMLDNGASQAEAVAFLNEWLVNDVTEVPASATGLVWDGERVFQAAKFGTEMQYQHLVFEEFARKIQPNINVFLVPDGFDTTIDPSIVAEFAHVVYRFGHSMLNESIDRFDPNFNPDHIGLIEGFLNPLQFQNNGGTTAVDADIAAGAVIRGMTRQVGNEIDEFVTGALRNNLLGLPLDLATINLARGRDTGVPSLNEARAQFYAATNQDALLKPYESWVDFAGHLKHEASIINFVAAYGTHSLIAGQTTIEGKRDAAMTIIFGQSFGGLQVPADAADFLNATGSYAGGSLGGLNDIDLWIGGLAEEIMPFGGMLGSTFNFVFEVQMEKLQNADRFYYLQRLDGLHLFGEMENNSFAAMIMRNTDATHLPSDVFSTPGLILEVDQSKQFNDIDGDGDLENADPTGGGVLTPLVVRNNPATTGADTNYLKYTGGDHVVLGGTNAADTLIAGDGDDTLYGDGGKDRLEGGFGNDIINGGDGDDIIVDSGGDDNIKAGAGNDVVHAGPGLDLVMGNSGQDFIFLGTDMGSEVFAGEGDDFIYGNKNAERILGNEGNDWIETGTFDGAPGDNFDEVFAHDGIDGHDVFLGDGGFDEFIGEGGDDIMVGSAGRGKMAGMSGFDWATYKDNTLGVNADLSIPIVFDESPTLPQNAALDEYASMEGLSGTRFNDTLSGSDAVAADRLPASQGGTEGFAGSALNAEGIALINGLQELLGAGVTSFSAGDIILGGDGSDRMIGRGGDDIIDGDKWLDVQIGVFAPGDTEHAGQPLELHNSMTTLAARMFSGQINPGQLSIVRTIRTDTTAGDIDTAVFSGARAEYDIDFNTDGTVIVSHIGGLATDGTDTVRNVERLEFADQTISLVAPTLDLHGDVTTTTTTTAPQAYRDTFDSAAHNNSNGSVNWAATPWVEAGDDGGVTTGQIQIDANNSNELRFVAGDGASITRIVNLTGVTTATLSFEYDRFNNNNSIDAGETLQVQYSPTGSFAAGSFTVLQTISSISGGFDGADTSSLSLNLTGATANAAIRFVVTGISGAGEEIRINNFNIATTTSTTTTTPGAPGNNYETSYTENGAGVAIAAGARIADDGTTIASARVVLTNASAGDVLSVAGGLPGGITSSVDASVPGQITLTLTGNSSIANYQTAIQQVRYSNSSDNPAAADRIFQVTVNDGLLNSAVATTTVHVTPSNDPPVGNADTVITNVATGVTFSIAQSALLANDADPEGSALSITAVNGSTGLNAPAVLGAGVINVADNGTPNGSFNYVVSDGTLSDPTNTVSITRVTGTINGGIGNEIIIGDAAGTTINGGGGNDTINAGDGSDTVSGGTGNDTILAGTGNDTIIWNAAGATDGFDLVNGEAGGTDTFIVNGAVGTAETFRIYERTAAIAAGVPVSGATTEIVITRTVGQTTTVVAELDNIEEISVNGLNTTANNGNNPTQPDGGTSAGDMIQVIGNFNGTSLNFSTITIDGNAGDDTVDISALQSAHRIVFRSNGGKDTIVGALRAQDVIELPPGKTLADYTEETDSQGVTTLTCEDHRITYTCSERPIVRECTDEEPPVEQPPVEEPPVEQPPVEQPPVVIPGVGNPVDEVEWGGRGHDRLWGHDGNDKLYGRSGHDRLWGQDGHDRLDGGEGHDRLYGGAGHDRLYGKSGHDRLEGGHGNDHLDGGSGKDRLYGGSGDDKLMGGSGDDCLSGGSGKDVLKGGAGNDRLTGGSGEDTFVFERKGGSDTITDFRNGHDRIDARSLSGVDDLSDLSLVQVDQSVMIARGSDILVLKGVTASDLDNSDFIF